MPKDEDHKTTSKSVIMQDEDDDQELTNHKLLNS